MRDTLGQLEADFSHFQIISSWEYPTTKGQTSSPTRPPDQVTKTISR